MTRRAFFVLIRNTKYEFILMSNTERLSKNEEVGIRVLIQMVLLRVLGTCHLVLRTTITIPSNNQLDSGRTFSSSPACLRLFARNKELGLPKHNASVVVCQPHSQ